MGKRKRRRRSGFNMQKIFKLLRIGAFVGPGVGQVIRWKDYPEAIPAEVLRVYSGFKYTTGEFKFSWLSEGWTPYLATMLATKGIQKLSGIIRSL